MKQVAVYILLSLTLSACTKQEMLITRPSDAIGFSIYAGKHTRSAGVTGIGTLARSGFVVYGYGHQSTYPAGGQLTTYISGLTVSSGDGGSTWYYEGNYYWPKAGRVSFFAFNTPPANTSLHYLHGVYSDYRPTLDFTQHEDPASHFDLMTALATDGTKAGGAVRMNFRHVLSRIGFHYTTVAGPETTISLNSVTLRGYGNLKNQGRYTYGGSWSGQTISGSPAADREITPLCSTGTPNNFLFLIPQQINDRSLSLSVTYTIVTADANLAGGRYTRTATKTVPLPAVTWEAGLSYRYDLTLSPTEAVFNGVSIENRNESPVDVP